MTAPSDAADPASPPGSPRPTISIVTPSFNQAPYLRAALESVLNQQGRGTDFELEYRVMDGGSTDGSAEIVAEYADRLAGWRSERDEGHYAAINEGFEGASGEIMGWLNSDDLYCPWALRTVAAIFSQNPDVAWLTSSRPVLWSRDGFCARVYEPLGFGAESLLAGRHLPTRLPFLGFLQQESTFWRRDLWDAVAAERAAQEPGGPPGALRPRFSLAGDHDLWLRFARHASPGVASVPLGGFRKQPDQRSEQMDAYLRQAEEAVAEARAAAGLPPLPPRRTKYPLWQQAALRIGTGPLAAVGQFRATLFEVEDPGAERARWVPSVVSYPGPPLGTGALVHRALRRPPLLGPSLTDGAASRARPL